MNGESKDGVITAISWDNRGVRLFVGDDKGHVKQMNVAKSKVSMKCQMLDKMRQNDGWEEGRSLR